ncbi:vacuolar-sorting protein SNF8 [Coprinopsis cinerea okayama7|uniref:Vacuolar-sorting protein SNF8 n=1 Tax=Coprinopsis cinerea (strain Okayama-7 / 130 / ATCC MYA-4618 / FGSC 9003) TaxID=240176 RepID=A8NGR1_COPC7|nr:vacuolar-sorting protein SNF8 [Coprinopsis cinerea okayama7\|eukprot:XP_001833576.1 vacuolar-sorting protein SNF8 [Coprinopsis cinerea okayama7\
MHRRGAGLSALPTHSSHSSHYAALSSTLNQTNLQNLQNQVSQFREALSRFAKLHRAKIREDPIFRYEFQKMCVSLGVDMLAGAKPSGLSGGFGELLGVVGDWQYELGVQIVDICVSTRERNGGLIEMEELIRILSKLRGVEYYPEHASSGKGKARKNAITENDVVQSINSLKPLGAGYQVVEIGGRKMVRSVMKELDEDQAVILAIAQEEGDGIGSRYSRRGRVGEDMLVERKGWTRERARTALENMLLRDGLCWLDDQDEECGRAYWIPSAMRWDTDDQPTALA